MDQYKWDEAKNQANKQKHGIGFELATQFDWSQLVLRRDLRKDYRENRWIGYGRIDGRGCAMVFVIRAERVRFVSLRPMHEKELGTYGL
jgi:uncharacterized protein